MKKFIHLLVQLKFILFSGHVEFKIRIAKISRRAAYMEGKIFRSLYQILSGMYLSRLEHSSPEIKTLKRFLKFSQS